ncbi:MAG: 2-dehydropantoate 2-reductase [Bacteroidales bacterium]|jgi:2-dehydropantoate 2-reductase
MKIAIIGTGGVGGYFGGKLAKAGFDVTFLARGKHLKAIKQKGLNIESIQGNFTVDPVKATDSFQAIGLADLVIIAVKAWQVREVAKELHNILEPDTLVMPLQNGISATEELSEQIHPDHIIGGLCRIISKISSPGVITHFGMEPEIVFGELNHSLTDRVSKLKAVFDTAGIKSHISSNIQSDLWKKFIAICVSGLLAVSKTTYGELRELKETRVLMIELLNEIYQLSQKIGINIEPDYINRTVALIDSFPYGSTSSLTRDVWEGKPSEIEYQNGTIVKLAELHGISVPVNRFVYSCILPMELKAMPRQ